MGVIAHWDSGNQLGFSYDSINNVINWSLNAPMHITFADSWTPLVSSHHVEFKAVGGADLSSNNWSAGAQTITWQGNMSPTTFRNSFLPFINSCNIQNDQNLNCFNFFYTETATGHLSSSWMAQYSDDVPHYIIIYPSSTVPIIPVTPTFTVVNAYDGYDAAKICITSSVANVQHWNVFRSNTSGGTYSLIGSFTPSQGTCYYDNTVITGQTYWYKISSVNLPWEEFSIIHSLTIQSVVDETCVVRTKAHITNATSGDTTSTYELWRSATEHGVYQRVGHVLNGGLDVYDKIDDYGVSYWYKVIQVTPDWTLSGITETNFIDVLTMPMSQTLSGVVNTGSTSIDLSWTDSNTWHQQYEIWQNISNAGYQLIATVTGNTYHAIINVNTLYDFKIRGKISCFAPTYIYSPFSNELTYSISPVILPPINLAANSISCTGATITWTNVNVSGQTGNHVKVFDGISGYTIIATVSSGSTSYVFTGLTPNTTYVYSVWAFNVGRDVKSQDITVITLDPAPFNLVPIVSYDTCAFTWSINDPPYGSAIRPEIKVYNTGNFSTKPLLSKNATSYTFTGLTFNTHYEARFVRIGSEFPSITVDFFTADFLAPSNLHTTSIGDKEICLQWQNNTINDNVEVWVRKENEAWSLYQTVSNVTNSICVTGLSMLTEYRFQVINTYGVFNLDSNVVDVFTTVTFLPPFCVNEAYSITGATCGNANGRIAMAEDYTIFYDFTLKDISGNTYILTDFFWTGLTASWYEIHAVVKPKFIFHYGGEECYLDWIAVPDSDTTLVLNATSIRPAICGGFGGNTGRIIFNFSDLSAATGWTFTLYNERHQQVNQQTITNINAIQYAASSDIYYGILENSNGCTYLISATLVDAIKSFAVEGIQKLYLTPWSPTISYDYYESSSDDWYVAGVDTQQFTSTKIKRYNDLQDFWYQIRFDTARMTYSQQLQNDKNGLTYQESITITIPHQDKAKWLQLVKLLSQRYIIVFQDSNEQWWTSFYRSGAEVKAYQLTDNQYTITFRHPSVQHMLTSMDYNYVKLNIL